MSKMLIVVLGLLLNARSATAAAACTAGTDLATGAANSAGTGGSDATCKYLLSGTYNNAGSIANCPAGKFCPGGSTVDANGGTYIAAGAAVAAVTGGALACPTGYTNAGGNTMVDESFCNGVAAGYYMGTTLADYTATDLTAAVALCPAGFYCPASAAAIAQANIDAAASTWNGVSGTFLMKNSVTGVAITANNAPNALSCAAGTTWAGSATASATSLAACTDVASGWAFTASQSATQTPTLTKCVASNYACAGATGVFKASAQTASTGIAYVGSSVIASFVLTSGTLTTLTIVGTTIASLGSGTNILASCPTGTTNAVTNGADISSCTAVAAGYYVPTTASSLALSTSTAVATNGVRACTAGNYCVVTAAKVTYLASGSTYTWAFTAYSPIACPTGTTWAGAPVNTATSAAVCDDLAPGYAILAIIPAQASAGSITALTTGITACAGGFYCPGQAAAITLAAGGISAGTTGNTFVWAAIAVPAITPPVACTSGFGSGGASAISAATGCNSIAPGFVLAASGTTPANCPAGSYCLGFSSAAGAVFAANAVTTGPTAAAGATACPTPTTNGGANTQTTVTSCTGLAAGYALAPGVTTTKFASLFNTCPTGVTCPAVPLFFGGAIDPVATGSATGRDDDFNYYGVQCLASAAYSATTSACSTAMDILNVTDLTAAVTTLTTTGTLLGLVNTGYFIAPNSYTPAVCPTGSACAGGDYLGDAPGAVVGVPAPCPVGSTTVAGGLTGCLISANFYASTASAVSFCPANYYCPGGGYLGIAGGSFQCTANSTVEVCNTFLDNLVSHSYAAGATTTNVAAPAAAAPAITVAAPAVTVTPAPITVTTAPVSVTPASQPITINVPAPVSAASTGSSALVLVLAALAALAAF